MSFFEYIYKFSCNSSGFDEKCENGAETQQLVKFSTCKPGEWGWNPTAGQGLYLQTRRMTLKPNSSGSSSKPANQVNGAKSQQRVKFLTC